MRVFSVVGLTLPAPDPEMCRRWWADHLALGPGGDDPLAFEIGDVRVSFGPALSVRLLGADLPDDPVAMVDPAGTAVAVVPPDLDAARRAEESISEFVTGAADLPGRPVVDLVDDVVALVVEAQQRIEALLADQPNNKVLATMLELGQRGRAVAATPEQPVPWHLHAASTLVSGCIRPGD